MKILFFGRGVISTQYAWAFEKAGHTVEFYVRQGKKEIYGNSVDLELWDARKSMKGKLVKEKWNVTLHEEIIIERNYDLIIVSVNPDQIADAVSYLAKHIGNTTVLFFNNFWEDPEIAVRPIPLNQVIFGFPGGGGGMENKKLRGGFFKSVFVESFRDGTESQNEEVRKLFRSAGFKVNVLKDVKSWLLNHFAFNAAIEVELVQLDSFKKLMETPQSLSMIGLNLREIIPVLKKKGAKVDLITKVFAYTPHKLTGFLFGNVIFAPKSLPRLIMEYSNFKPGASLRQVIDDARKFGVNTPRLEAAQKFK